MKYLSEFLKYIDLEKNYSNYTLINYKDVIVVASVSCIYGIGEKEEYEKNKKASTGAVGILNATKNNL